MMFRIPTVTKNLLIINLIAFIATFVFQLRGIDLADIGGLHFFMASNFHLYQLVTYLFLHASFMHILSNMFGLWMFGCVIENVWGPKKFLFYYIDVLFGLYCGIWIWLNLLHICSNAGKLRQSCFLLKGLPDMYML